MTKRFLAVVILAAMCACAGAQVRNKGSQSQVEPPRDPADVLASWAG